MRYELKTQNMAYATVRYQAAQVFHLLPPASCFLPSAITDGC